MRLLRHRRVAALVAMMLSVAGDAMAAPRAFRDCADCPPMIAVGAVAFGAHEVTVGEWSAFADATQRTPADCGTDAGRGSWRDPGFAQDASHPVVCVTWEDARDYAAWLAARTGKPYRLPSGAEWARAARAGARTVFAWGNVARRARANYGADACCAPFASGKDRWLHTAPVQSFPANRAGFFDMAGNVWEWTSDCATPACNGHVIRGGSWLYPPDQMRPAQRRSHATPGVSLGFRVARDL